MTVVRSPIMSFQALRLGNPSFLNPRKCKATLTRLAFEPQMVVAAEVPCGHAMKRSFARLIHQGQSLFLLYFLASLHVLHMYIYTQYLLFVHINIYIYIHIMHDRTFLSLLGASGPKGPSFRGGYSKIRYRIV